MIRNFLLVLSLLYACVFVSNGMLLDDFKPSEDGIYAKLISSKGTIWIMLEFEKTPMAVANFIGLSEGKIENTYRKLGNPFYNGLTFHRVVENRAIQGGCPEGNGFGNPGYRFKDEIAKELKHDRPGIVSMANSGKNTNGSQFFITIGVEPDLDGKYVIFGSVLNGQKIVEKLEIDDLIKSIEIIRLGSKANSFNINAAFPEKARKKT